MRLNIGVRIAVSLGMIGVIFAGCSAIHNVQQSAASGFHSGFRSSFKSSFIKSCTAQVGTTEALCGCVESTLERANTDDQLIKMSADDPETSKKLGEAARACRYEGSAQPAARSPASIPHASTPTSRRITIQKGPRSTLARSVRDWHRVIPSKFSRRPRADETAVATA